jgi:hypothetical protein
MIRHFHRSKSMAQAIAVALSAGISIGVLASNPEFQYTSRGHGKGLIGVNYFRGSRNKYKTHQGAKEVARRASQIERGILQIN